MAITQNYLPQVKELTEQEAAVLGVAAYIGNYPSASQIIKVEKLIACIEYCNLDGIAAHALKLGILKKSVPILGKTKWKLSHTTISLCCFISCLFTGTGDLRSRGQS